jgi:hypothetical protein
MTSTVLLGKLVFITHVIHLFSIVWLMFLVFLRHDNGPVFPPENRPQVRVICNPFDLTLRNRTSRFN